MPLCQPGKPISAPAGSFLAQLSPVNRAQKHTSIGLKASVSDVDSYLVRDRIEVLFCRHKTGVFAGRIAAVFRNALARNTAEYWLAVVENLESNFLCWAVPHPRFVRAVMRHGILL